MAEKKHNIFISHYGEDERQLDSLKQRLRDHGCDIRNSSVEKKKYRPYKVNYEIRNAARQGKVIIGIYEHGCKDDVELPEAFKRYGTTTLGWNSVDKLIDVIEGRIVVSENPNGSASGPIQNIIRIKCN